MDYISIIIGLFTGGVLGYLIGKLKTQNTNSDKILELSKINATLMEQQVSGAQKVQELSQMKEKLSQEFENLANKIFQEKFSYFQKESSQNMDLVLRPFKEKLSEFQNTVVKYREDEMKEVSSLKNEIENIFKLNQKLATEAHELTKALKGDKKGQGNWGELILERVLESSGLREGEEYSLQAKEMGLVSDEGRALRPDVIIKLPEGKHLIIDSKVTLVSYDKYLNSEDAGIQALALKEFTQGIKNHITTLAEKKYQNLDKLQSPDFVLMFIPIEGAFATALQNDGELFKYGWEKKIIIVSPTTLMVTLRTVESIWKQEKQNKYAMDIARQAGDLYDKFVSFIEDLENLKRSIEKSKENLDAALNKLTTGRGNLVGRVEKLKALGAKASKSLSIDFEEHE